MKREALNAQWVREQTIAFSCRHNAGHLAPSLSSVEILSVLFRDYLRFNEANARDEGRDRLVFSKGHGCYAYYVILNALGFIPSSIMDSFSAESSRLKGCVSADSDFMLEASTGSLGHGLPLAVGMAQSFKMQGKPNKVVCIIGDGEMQEGSNFEALASAYRFKLDNLLIIIDANGLSAMDRVESIGLPNERLSKVLRAYTQEGCFFDLDGHDEEALGAAYRRFYTHKQEGMSIIVAHTIKGKGVEMIEGRVKYHYRCPTQDGYVFRHSALRLKSAIDKARGVDEPLVLSPYSPCQSPDLSSQILECQDSRLNSSLGNHSPDCGSLEAVITAQVTPAPKLPQSKQSNTANTRIVSGEIQDSKAHSESTLSDSHSPSRHSEAIAEESINHVSRDISNYRPQYDKGLESYPHASLESKTDSELTSAVGHCPTAIKSGFSSERSSEQALKASSGRGDCQGGRERLRNSSPSPLDEKEKEILKNNRILEVKAKDSEKLDSESKNPANRDISNFRPQYDKDSESMGRVESARVGDSEKQDSDSKNLESAIDLEAKKLASRDTSAFTKPQYDKGLESYPHASLESNTDSDSKKPASMDTSPLARMSEALAHTCIYGTGSESPALDSTNPPLLASKKQVMDALFPYFERDERMVLLVGDMGFAVLDRYFERFPHRVFNVGIAEQAMVGMAAGMWLSGLKPIVYAQIPFLTMRSYEQVRYDICEHAMDIILVGVGADNYFKALGRSHCMDSDDIALMGILPHLEILSSDENGVKSRLERYFDKKHLVSPPPRYILGAYNVPPIYRAKIPKNFAALRAGRKAMARAVCGGAEVAYA